MAQSLNKVVDLQTTGTSYLSISGKVGKFLVGDQALEFYADRNVEDYIQIPWDQIDHVAASVMGRTKSISRFAIFTKSNGNYSFSTRDNKATLRAIRAYIGKEKLVRSPNFWFVFKHGLMAIPQLPRLIKESFIKKK